MDTSNGELWIGLAFTMWLIASVVHKIHKIPSRWKGTISIFLALAGIWATYLWADKEIKGKITILVETNMALVNQNSRLIATQESMLDSLRLLRLDHAKTTAIHDSILIKIARVDSCIDRHFRHVNRRISNIGK